MRLPAMFRAAVLITTGILLGSLFADQPLVFAQKDDDEETSSLPLDELRAFTETFALIKRNYVEPVDDKKLLDAALRGMLAGLDPHSSYLDGEDYKELKTGTSGEFGGLGIEVGMEDGFVKVIAPIDDTPAQRAGIEAGDLIVRLDEQPVKGMSLSDAVKIMRGKPGTDIELTVVREGEAKPLKIVITRAVIQITSVRSRILEPGYGYLRVSHFQVNTGKKMREELANMNDGQPLQGLVLDLRNNPGGVLTSAVSVADAFITDGLIVYTKGRQQDAEQEFKASPDDLLKGVPIVVLVNDGSASASEIVAGALQDHRRAIIMGRRTFGKGSVQTVLPMRHDAAVKLTTARYYTPNGRSIQAEGIEPDITLEDVRLTRFEREFERVQERDLAGHLTGDEETGTDGKAKNEEKALAAEDYALYEALNLLKALRILAEAGA